ncbi:MAG: metallophosphoesterase [Bacillota bacterium]|nr:metallophosphoesterase [Bacillota bacterium]
MKNNRLGRIYICLLFFVLILLTILFVSVSWQGLKISYYTVESDRIEEPVRIVHISDLHSTFFGDGQEDIINAVKEAEPDIICFTGDIADDDIPHEATVILAEALGKSYDCYYVSGNHEYHAPEGLEWVKSEIFEANGIKVLDPGTETLVVKGQRISVSGLDDIEKTGYDKWLNQLKECSESKDDDTFSILLSHRPERVKEFSECDFDLILAGHTHGGQIIIPGVFNGIFASSQGFFPQYAGGEYDIGDSKMIVSRGMVKNILPRTFNPPELVIIDAV